jgi:hypothetical protein
MQDLEEFVAATKDLQDNSRTLLESLTAFWENIQIYITIFQIEVTLTILLTLKMEFFRFYQRNDVLSREEKILLNPFVQTNESTTISPKT